MTIILDLSTELLDQILHILRNDSSTLKILCLVGNHRLTACARPYTWGIIDALIGDEDSERRSQRLASRIKEFFSHPEKYTAVHTLNVKLYGYFDYSGAILELMHNFSKLVNCTTAYVCCIDSLTYMLSWSSGFFVRHVLEDIPSLTSISVDGCKARSFKEFLDFKKNFEAENLAKVTLRYCNPTLDYLWGDYCPNLQVIHIEGGDRRRFWERHKLPETIEFDYYTPSEIGTYSVLTHACKMPLKQLHLKLDWNWDDMKYNLEMNQISEFFEEHSKSNPPHPLCSLEDLWIDIPTTTTEFAIVLKGLHRPTLRRFLLKPLLLNYAGADQSILKLLEDTKSIWPQFSLLEDLYLPFDGLSTFYKTLLIQILSELPSLRQLTFSNPGSQPVSDAAMSYASEICSLESILWEDAMAFDIKRGQDGNAEEPIALMRRDYIVDDAWVPR